MQSSRNEKRVDRVRGVDVARLQVVDEPEEQQHGAEAVGRRVAVVEGHRVAPVGALHLDQPTRHLVERLVPADLLPAVAAPPDRAPQAVGVVVDVLERHRLRADVAAAEGIVLVAANGEDALAVVLDGDAADGFAEGADPEVGPRRVCLGRRRAHRPSPPHSSPEEAG